MWLTMPRSRLPPHPPRSMQLLAYMPGIKHKAGITQNVGYRRPTAPRRPAVSSEGATQEMGGLAGELGRLFDRNGRLKEESQGSATQLPFMRQHMAVGPRRIQVKDQPWVPTDFPCDRSSGYRHSHVCQIDLFSPNLFSTIVP